MMKDFAIIGSGGLGRELYSWYSQSKKHIAELNCLGFLDDINSEITQANYPKIIGKISTENLSEIPNFLIAIANLEFRRNAYEQLNIGNKIIGFIHESVLIGTNVVIDPSLVIFPNTIISCDTTIGKSVLINNGSQIGHDVEVGNFVNIMANVDVGGGCKIGNNVTIGSGATVLPKVKIPDNTTIGAGSVVLRSIKEAGTYFGNPAKKIL